MAIEEPWKGVPSYMARFTPPGQPPEEPLGMEDMLRGLIRQDLGLSQNIPDNLRNFVRQDLRQQGYEIVGELPTREDLAEREAERARRLAEAQKGVGEYIEEPGFWQNLKDVSIKVAKGEVDPFGLVAQGLVRGMSFGNIDPHTIIEKISGKKGFAEAARNIDRELVPEEIQRLVTTPSEIAGTLVPLSLLFSGAAIPAVTMTKVPFLQAVAQGTMVGIATGLLRKPEREGALNRLKQVPGDVLFFSALSGALVTFQQMARIANYNRAAKFYKKVNWEAPPVPPDGKPFTSRQMRDLFNKMDRNATGAGIKLTAEESEIIDTMKETGGWNNAVKSGWIKPTTEWMTTGRPGFMPRAPRMSDIFRDPSKIPFVERPSVGVPPEEAPPRPEPVPTEVRPTAVIPPTEAPLVRRPLEPTPPKEAPPTARIIPPEVRPPAAMVDIIPTAEGGWQIKLPQPPIAPPPGWAKPGPTIPWRPVEPELLPPHVKPPKVIKPKKLPKFKNPFYEAINLQGGVAPNADYPYSELKQLFPIGLIKKTGMPMDVLAQAMRHEFPTIESDNDLWNMADDIRRARATFRDERTGDEHLPPREEVAPEAQRFADREPAEMTKAEFNAGIKLAIKDTKTAKIHLAKEGENIHAMMLKRLQDQGVIYEDMEAGFTIPGTGQFLKRYSMKPGPEKYEMEYEHETFHRDLIEKAMKEGKYISPEILEQHKIDYPELFKKPVEVVPKEVPRVEPPVPVKPTLEGTIRAHMEGKTLDQIKEIRKDLTPEEQKIVDKLLAERKRKPPEVLRVAEEVPVYEKVLYRGVSGVPVDEGMFGKGTYFTNDMEYASRYALTKEKKVLTKRVRLNNPYFVEDTIELDKIGDPAFERALKEGKSYKEALEVKSRSIREKLEYDGYDGIVIRARPVDEKFFGITKMPSVKEGFEEIIVFHPAKSVLSVEEVPPIAPKEPTLTEIEKVFEEMAIPRIKRGVLADQIIRNYKPEKAPLKTYIKSILPKITEEGELRIKPTLKRRRAERITPAMEEVIAGRAERPEDIFERAEEEARVQKIFKQSAKTDRERDILDRKILKGQSYDDIGKAHGITRQRAEQIFKQSFDKVKDHPDVKDIIKRKMRQANLGPIPSEQDLKDLGRLIKKYFFSSKGVDKVIDSAGDKRIQSIMAENFDATPEAQTIRTFLRKNKNPALDAFVLEAIKGEVPIGGTALPAEIKDAITTMRDRMDKLSQLIMAHGGLTEQTEAAFDSRLGSYIGKFYRLHQQRRWDPPKQVKDRFKSMLNRNYPDRFGQFTEEELDNFVEGIINEERKFGFGLRKTKRVPTGHFKKRVRLTQEWKDLAGEYLDPVWLYLKTINVQSAMAYNAEFLNKIKQTYPESWVTDAVEAEKRGWQKYRLPANYGYGELKNKYVHPELYKYITQEVDPAVSGMEKAIMKFITNPFKATKTIGSMPTQARNLFSNFPLTLLNQNFILNPANLPYYIRAFRTYMGRNKPEFHKEWVKLIKEGVTGVEFYGTDIPKIQETLMKIDPVDWGDKLIEMALAPAKFGIRKMGSLYNLNDALFRIATYYKRTEHFGETPEQAVEELNRSLQNYRKLPIVADVLRRYTIFGPFISFRWNICKIMTNQAVQAGKEMGKKGTRMKGSLRLARLLFFLGLPSLIAKISKEIFDVDDDEVERLEAFLPKYRKHGIFAYFRGREGQLKAFDLTFIYPTGEVQRATKALLNRNKEGKWDPDIDTFVDAIDLFAHPIFDSWSIMIEGRQPYWGTKIEGGFFKRLAEIIKMLWVPASAPLPSMKSLTESMKAGKFEPREGALTGHQMRALIDAWNQEPDRYGRVRSLPEEVKNFFTGWKTWNVEPDKLLMQSIKAMRSEAEELKWQLKSWIASNRKAPAWEIKDKTDNFNKRITKILERASEAMDLYKELKRGGFLVQKEK